MFLTSLSVPDSQHVVLSANKGATLVNNLFKDAAFWSYLENEIQY